MQVGLIGYGFGGKTFHAPVISAVEGLHLAMVYETKPGNVAEIQHRYPAARVVSDVHDILRDSTIELVVVATPNTLHYELAMEALRQGKHVVVEKPFTVTSDEAETLLEMARTSGKVLTVHHNRRWDSDFKTMRKILEGNLLGDLVEFEAYYDRFAPVPSVGWRDVPTPGSGTHYDLGVHLLDQALTLFGLPEQVRGDLRVQRPGGTAVDSFDFLLRYPKLTVKLGSSLLARIPRPRFSAFGLKGAFVKYGLDVQEAALAAGRCPAGDPAWGKEAETDWGRLCTEVDGVPFQGRVESEPGDYRAFYQNVLTTIKGESHLQVRPEEAAWTIRIMEYLEQSHLEQRWISL